MSRRGFCHSAEVVSLGDGDIVELMIVSATACEGCHAKGSCGASGSKDGQKRIVSVVSNLAGELNVGERVELSIKYSIGAYVVVVAYIVPLVVFVATIGVAIAMGVEQGVSALLGFLLAAFYYCGVYLFRNRFERVINFEIRKL
ncbi:MAG: SoxR reducing system RseC family protein [Rikenellaceae bacterium]